MDWWQLISGHIGLVVFTVICSALTVYLLYALVHPEDF